MNLSLQEVNTRNLEARNRHETLDTSLETDFTEALLQNKRKTSIKGNITKPPLLNQSSSIASRPKVLSRDLYYPSKSPCAKEHGSPSQAKRNELLPGKLLG